MKLRGLLTELAMFTRFLNWIFPVNVSRVSSAFEIWRKANSGRITPEQLLAASEEGIFSDTKGMEPYRTIYRSDGEIIINMDGSIRGVTYYTHG